MHSTQGGANNYKCLVFYAHYATFKVSIFNTVSSFIFDSKLLFSLYNVVRFGKNRRWYFVTVSIFVSRTRDTSSFLLPWNCITFLPDKVLLPYLLLYNNSWKLEQESTIFQYPACPLVFDRQTRWFFFCYEIKWLGVTLIIFNGKVPSAINYLIT